ncbi:hypothetical protein Zmor_001803 [Zophobas morio]|uniref:Uncharacterized protein n=1 Tax=Zophobas morio TaxID=2755281 RepID=A0AA38J9S5_9CUCU|nr:hypothetical protein Zmor_001803 [Zophobas morio]
MATLPFHVQSTVPGRGASKNFLIIYESFFHELIKLIYLCVCLRKPVRPSIKGLYRRRRLPYGVFCSSTRIQTFSLQNGVFAHTKFTASTSLMNSKLG